MKGKGNIWYSGSTERLSDRESRKEKGFIRAVIQENGSVTVDFERLPARPWARFDIKDAWERSVSDILTELRGCAGPPDMTGAIVSLYLHNLDPRQGIELSNSTLSGIFSGALAVLPHRVFRKSGSSGAEPEMESGSLEGHFKNYLETGIEDRVVSERLYCLAMKYFEKHDRDGE